MCWLCSLFLCDKNPIHEVIFGPFSCVIIFIITQDLVQKRFMSCDYGNNATKFRVKISNHTISWRYLTKSKFSKLFFDLKPLSSGEPFRYETVSQTILNMIDSIQYCNMRKNWLHLHVDNDFDGFKHVAKCIKWFDSFQVERMHMQWVFDTVYKLQKLAWNNNNENFDFCSSYCKYF